MISLWLLGLSLSNHVHAIVRTHSHFLTRANGEQFTIRHAVHVPKEKSAPNKIASSSDDCDRHRRKRISKSKSSRSDVYVSPYKPNSSSDEEYISDTSVRRKEMPKMPKSKKYVPERKKDQELEKVKTESEDTDSDSITEDNKTGKRRSRSQQRRRDKGKSTKPKIVSSKLTNRKKYSKSKTRLLASEAFYYLLIVLNSSDNLGVTVRRTRDELAETYFYNSIDNCYGENAKSLL